METCNIIVKKENAEKLMRVFEKVQGRATVRTIYDFNQFANIVDDIEKRIGNMTKKAKEGTKVHYDFRQHFPNAYKYQPESTHFTLVFTKGNWKLTEVRRGYCPNKNCSYAYELMLSDTAKEAILDRYK